MALTRTRKDWEALRFSSKSSKLAKLLARILSFFLESLEFTSKVHFRKLLKTKQSAGEERNAGFLARGSANKCINIFRWSTKCGNANLVYLPLTQLPKYICQSTFLLLLPSHRKRKTYQLRLHRFLLPIVFLQCACWKVQSKLVSVSFGKKNK